MSVWQDIPPNPGVHEHTRPPAGSTEHDPPFSQGLGLHAPADTKGQESKGRTGSVVLAANKVHTYHCFLEGEVQDTK